MISTIIDKIEEKQFRKDPLSFDVGDTVNVSVKIVEGEKTRIQIFNGTVIAKKGRGINENFTVRRIVNNEGVERTFPVNSPNVQKVEVVRSGFTRRSKLYFLRGRQGKAVRLREVWKTEKKKK